MTQPGEYKTEIFRIGFLSDDDLINGQKFTNPGNLDVPYEFTPGAGNRVNLLVLDGISNATRTNANLISIGVAVAWSFFGDAIDTENYTARILDNGFDPPVGQLDPRDIWWQEAKIDFIQSPAESNDSFQAGETRINYFQFPETTDFFEDDTTGPDTGIEDGNRAHVIPLIARGDFMRVFFYAKTNILFPGFTASDRVDVWAMPGQDAPGPSRL